MMRTYVYVNSEYMVADDVEKKKITDNELFPGDCIRKFSCHGTFISFLFRGNP